MYIMQVFQLLSICDNLNGEVFVSIYSQLCKYYSEAEAGASRCYNVGDNGKHGSEEFSNYHYFVEIHIDCHSLLNIPQSEFCVSQ